MLAGSPATLRAYARMRSELRHGTLPLTTQQRIALAVAQHQGSEFALATLLRTGREAGLGIDEMALAREFDSHDETEATLLRYVKALLEDDGAPPLHVHEEAREAGWEDEQILEAIAHVALNSFANLVTRAGDVPMDGSGEEARAAPGRMNRGPAVELRRRRTSFTVEAMPAPGAGVAVEAQIEDADIDRAPCCSLYHRAIEMVGKRWTGAILLVMMDGPLRFSEIRQLVPDLSDRLLSERLKELEGERIVARRQDCDHPSCVRYELTEKGEALEPAVRALKRWAHD